MPLGIASTNEERVVVTAEPKTAAGRPARVDGALTIEIQDGESTFLQDPAEPLTVRFVSSDNPGTTHYLVEVDTDLGEGVETVSDTVEYVVGGAKASSFGLVAGVVEPK